MRGRLLDAGTLPVVNRTTKASFGPNPPHCEVNMRWGLFHSIGTTTVFAKPAQKPPHPGGELGGVGGTDGGTDGGITGPALHTV